MLRTLLSEPLLPARSFVIDDRVKPYLDLIFQMIVLAVITNAVMDFAFIRHRWRVVFLAARLSGLVAGCFWLSWPHTLLFFPVCWSFNFGFVDPRLHMASIKRNPEHVIFKTLDVIAALTHHTGASQLGGTLLWGVIHTRAQQQNDPNQISPPSTNIFDMPLFLVVALLAEFLAYGVDVAVLMRQAPRWFNYVPVCMFAVQVVCLAGCLLWVKTIVPPVQLWTLAVGNTILVFRFGIMKSNPSTHEKLEGSVSDRDDFSRRSVARMVYAQEGLTTADRAADDMAQRMLAEGPGDMNIPHGIHHKTESNDGYHEVYALQSDLEAQQIYRISNPDLTTEYS